MWDRSTSTSYEIRVEGILSNEWSDWLGGLAITPYDAHTTLIAGPVPDQAALFGILAQLHALNVTLIAVQRVNNCRVNATACASTRTPSR